MKTKKVPPPIVLFAQLMGDHDALSRLGRAGAMRKKEMKERREKVFMEIILAECLQRDHEANLDICPVD